MTAESTADSPMDAPMGACPIIVCVKWVASRIDVDQLDGTIHERPHEQRFSEADLAAVETALDLADAGARDDERPVVTVICSGPSDADDSLRDLLSVGVDNAIRVDTGDDRNPAAQPGSAEVAKRLAETIDTLVGAGSMIVVCGDASMDRGSGSVPAFLAHHLDASQALGLVDVTAEPNGGLTGVRRLDGARREVLSITAPAVISVEGSVAKLRRGSLAATLRSRDAVIEVVPGGFPHALVATVTEPYRPRTRVVAPPSDAVALGRIVELTGARSDRTPPRTVTAEPEEAAQLILDQLREWGYEWGTDSQI